MSLQCFSSPGLTLRDWPGQRGFCKRGLGYSACLASIRSRLEAPVRRTRTFDIFLPGGGVGWGLGDWGSCAALSLSPNKTEQNKTPRPARALFISPAPAWATRETNASRVSARASRRARGWGERGEGQPGPGSPGPGRSSGRGGGAEGGRRGAGERRRDRRREPLRGQRPPQSPRVPAARAPSQTLRASRSRRAAEGEPRGKRGRKEKKHPPDEPPFWSCPIWRWKGGWRKEKMIDTASLFKQRRRSLVAAPGAAPPGAGELGLKVAPPRLPPPERAAAAAERAAGTRELVAWLREAHGLPADLLRLA